MQMLILLFQQFPGFQVATLVKETPGLGLIEFDSAKNASAALSGLQGFRLNASHSLVLCFA
jgi:U2 small nuclear ribonucleoprotein B''